jgi:hypothetical protein
MSDVHARWARVRVHVVMIKALLSERHRALQDGDPDLVDQCTDLLEDLELQLQKIEEETGIKRRFALRQQFMQLQYSDTEILWISPLDDTESDEYEVWVKPEV